MLPVYGLRLLIAGPSGRGKSTRVSAVVDRLTAAKYQVCLFDPEGDYDEFEPLLSLGGPDRIPASTEVCAALSNPSQSVSINLLGVPLRDRPTFFQSLLVHVQELRVKTGRPHWIVIDGRRNEEDPIYCRKNGETLQAVGQGKKSNFGRSRARQADRVGQEHPSHSPKPVPEQKPDSPRDRADAIRRPIILGVNRFAEIV